MIRSIPTPSTSSFSFGPLTIHFYALCIIAGIAIAIWLGDRRYRARGGAQGVVGEVAIWSVPAGIIGGRLYHVITSPDNYFGQGSHPIDALKIWEGGLGIWGAIAMGTLTAWWRLQRLSAAQTPGIISFAHFADCLAPGVLFAQAIGRFGNWFNGELFGRPTQVAWALEIPPALRPAGYENFASFHPTFLYESLWCVAIALLILGVEKRFRPGQGFLFYIAAYCLGRSFIESLRIDSAHTIAGLRVNLWMSILVGLVCALQFIRLSGRSAATRDSGTITS